MRNVSVGLIAAVAALATPALGQAEPYVVGNCKLNAPVDWVASKSRIARADKKVWASLLEAPTVAEIVNLELGLKAVKVSEDGGHVLLLSTVSGSGQTNKQFHAVSKSSPACLADVTSVNGADDAAAKQIALTVSKK
jgi:hypothetical protein